MADQLGAVRDQEHGPTGLQPTDSLGDDADAGRIEVGGRLVEDHERRVPD
jgi:hypothetical protein